MRSRWASSGRQVLRRLALMVLLTFVAGFLSATAGQAFEPFLDGDQVSHADGHRCPDPADQDHPCGPTCACACCRVSSAVLDHAFLSPSVSLSDFTESILHLSDDLHPEDVAFRIEHPPRA